MDHAHQATSNLYWSDVDPDAPNNPHSFALDLVGKNKRVLELGPAAGHVTRALVAGGCRVVGIELDPDAAAAVGPVAERIIVGDLSDPEVLASAIDDEGFDVVMAGDVLEHLPDPLQVLRGCRRALKPGGYVVVSLPNVAHADVKLQLLAGQFPYRDMGLLDRTHLHFFTIASIHELLRDAGLLLVDLRRVVVPAFGTEQAVDRASVAPEVLEAALVDEEAETYQFVLRAVVHDGNAVTAQMAERSTALEWELERAQRELERAEAHRAELAATLEQAQAALAEERNKRSEAVAASQHYERAAQEHAAHVEALRSTRSYRLMAPLRAVFARRG